MTKHKHTKTPWVVGERNVVMGDHPGDRFYVALPFTDHLTGPVLLQEIQAANARRIVACVNICEGIGTEDLEQHSDVVSAQLATEYTLQQQNEDLLTALEEVSASLAWVALGQCRAMEAPPIMPPEMAIELARAAIAKATA